MDMTAEIQLNKASMEVSVNSIRFQWEMVRQIHIFFKWWYVKIGNSP